MSRDITQLHPKLRNLANQLVSICNSQGLIIKITDCVRDAEEQQACVNRGTSSVRYPNSHHNWGTAFDICRNDGVGAYAEDGNFFARVGEIGRNLGLEWGGDWTSPVDKPHFQLHDWGTSTAKLKAMYGSPSTFMAQWGVYVGTTVVPNVVNNPAAPIATHNQKVNVHYTVFTDKWLGTVNNLDDYAGWKEKPIKNVAIGVDAGSVKYRVHVLGGGWLPYVTGCNINDGNNGYAGNNNPIDAVEVIYYTPNSIRPYKYAKYRVAGVNSGYFGWQSDNTKSKSMDGYAGMFGKPIGKFQINIE